MLIWSCNAQNNIFNNIIMVNFRDIKPQSHFRTLKWRHNGLRKNLEPCVIMAEGANVSLLLAWLFNTNILESLVHCWYTSLPTDLWRIERGKTTSEVKKSPGGLGYCKRSHCSIIKGKLNHLRLHKWFNQWFMLKLHWNSQ